MGVSPTSKRATTILQHTQAGPRSFAPTNVGNLATAQKDLHPLPMIHFDAQDVTPQGLQKKVMDVYEAMRVATQPMRQDPASAPCYVRGVQFKNTSNAATNVTVTFRHALGQAHTGLHVCRSQNAAYQGYEVPNPQGQDATQYATVTTLVPAGVTAIHDFALWGD